MSVEAVTITYFTASRSGDIQSANSETIHYVPWIASIAQMGPGLIARIKSENPKKNTENIIELIEAEHKTFKETPHLSGWYSGKVLSEDAIKLVQMVRRFNAPIPMEISRPELKKLAEKRLLISDETQWVLEAKHQLIDVQKRKRYMPYWEKPLIGIWFFSGLFSFAKGLHLLIGGMSVAPALAAVLLGLYSTISLVSYSQSIPRYLDRLQRWMESKFYSGGSWTVGALAVSAAFASYVALKILLQISGTTASFVAAGGMAAWLPAIAPLCGGIHGFFKTLFDAENWEKSWYKAGEQPRYTPPLPEINNIEEQIKKIFVQTKRDTASHAVLTCSQAPPVIFRDTAVEKVKKTCEVAVGTEELYLSWIEKRQSIEGAVYSGKSTRDVGTSTEDLEAKEDKDLTEKPAAETGKKWTSFKRIFNGGTA